MAGVGQDLETAAEHGRMGVAPVLDRDHRIALAPDDQGRHLLGEVESIAGADPLADRVNHRTQGVEEGKPGAGVVERRITARDLAEVCRGSQADPGQERTDGRTRLEHLRRGDQGRTSSEPGSEAARRSRCTSRPRPPLEIRASRSQRSGNW